MTTIVDYLFVTASAIIISVHHNIRHVFPLLLQRNSTGLHHMNTVEEQIFREIRESKEQRSRAAIQEPAGAVTLAEKLIGQNTLLASVARPGRSSFRALSRTLIPNSYSKDLGRVTLLNYTQVVLIRDSKSNSDVRSRKARTIGPFEAAKYNTTKERQHVVDGTVQKPRKLRHWGKLVQHIPAEESLPPVNEEPQTPNSELQVPENLLQQLPVLEVNSTRTSPTDISSIEPPFTRGHRGGLSTTTREDISLAIQANEATAKPPSITMDFAWIRDALLPEKACFQNKFHQPRQRHSEYSGSRGVARDAFTTLGQNGEPARKRVKLDRSPLSEGGVASWDPSLYQGEFTRQIPTDNSERTRQISFRKRKFAHEGRRYSRAQEAAYSARTIRGRPITRVPSFLEEVSKLLPRAEEKAPGRFANPINTQNLANPFSTLPAQTQRPGDAIKYQDKLPQQCIAEAAMKFFLGPEARNTSPVSLPSYSPMPYKGSLFPAEEAIELRAPEEGIKETKADIDYVAIAQGVIDGDPEAEMALLELPDVSLDVHMDMPGLVGPGKRPVQRQQRPHSAGLR